MPITSLEDLQKVANFTLREAMANERSRRWPKVVQSYRRLLRMIRPSNLPKNYDKPPWLSTLYYELYYHLGIALQYVKEDKRAAVQYTKALEAVSIPKGGCMAGCNSNSCLMTPLYARRAAANARAGDLRGAIRDAERAVVLDSRNPDVYCIRSLARATRSEEKEALKDAEAALQINPSHPCALILRGTLIQALSLGRPKYRGAGYSDEFTDWDNFGKKEAMCADHVKACNINPDCHNYLAVHNFTHPEIPTFYDRFLYSLNIPHTLSEVVLVTDGRNQLLSKEAQKACAADVMNILGITPPKCIVSTDLASFKSPMKFRRPKQQIDTHRRPFRCGTPASDRDANIQRRRREYGDAVRQHISKPRSTSDFIAWLENPSRARPSPAPPRGDKRPVSAAAGVSRTTRPITTHPRPVSASPRVTMDKGAVTDVKTTSASANAISGVGGGGKPSPQQAFPHRTDHNQQLQPHTTTTNNNVISSTSYVDPTQKKNYIQAYLQMQRILDMARMAKKKKVFQPMNLEDAPRMYYKPWKGDRLPMADKDPEDKHPKRPPFK